MPKVTPQRPRSAAALIGSELLAGHLGGRVPLCVSWAVSPASFDTLALRAFGVVSSAVAASPCGCSGQAGVEVSGRESH